MVVQDEVVGVKLDVVPPTFVDRSFEAGRELDRRRERRTFSRRVPLVEDRERLIKIVRIERDSEPAPPMLVDLRHREHLDRESAVRGTLGEPAVEDESVAPDRQRFDRESLDTDVEEGAEGRQSHLLPSDDAAQTRAPVLEDVVLRVLVERRVPFRDRADISLDVAHRGIRQRLRSAGIRCELIEPSDRGVEIVQAELLGAEELPVAVDGQCERVELDVCSVHLPDRNDLSDPTVRREM